ncbi:MAG: IclR family transcriptional regulator [Planctomycetes bacterium]|nr:IclR family transcriptional regulator [Planctomycetota bacterium]
MLRPLQEGLLLLERLSDQPEALAISDAARVLGWPKSRVHRILAALVAAGYVEQDADRRYRATPKVLRLASGTMSRHPLRQQALPFLRRACAETGADATLSVLHEDRSLAIATDSATGDPAADPFSMLGRSSWLHGAANGKVLLAWLPLVEQRDLLARLELPALTRRTITDRARLAAELERVRERGWAVNDRENHPDVFTVSVPVFDGFHRCVAAVGLSQRPDAADEKRSVAVLRRESAALTRRIAGV